MKNKKLLTSAEHEVDRIEEPGERSGKIGVFKLFQTLSRIDNLNNLRKTI